MDCGAEHRARRRAARVPRVAPRAARAERARGRPVPDRHPRADEEPARDRRDNDTGISARPTLDPAHRELRGGPPGERRRGTGAPRMEATRFNQFGYWQGEIRYDGHTCAIDPRRVYGTKDRSWGVRPVGSRRAERAAHARPADLLPVGAAALGGPLHARGHLRERVRRDVALGRHGRADLRDPDRHPRRGGSAHRAARGRRGADRLHPGHAPRAARDDHAGRARRRAPGDRARAAALLPHEGHRLLAPDLGPRHVEGRARLRGRVLEGRRRRRDGAREPAHPAGGARDLRRPRRRRRARADRLGPYRKYGFTEFLDMAR